ncbi:MAG: NAD(P)H-hydrate dehydratase [Bacteroidota bacterium]
MKILSAQQISALDQATIEREPITSSELMERASTKGFTFITNQFPDLNQHFTIFCGPGNNGGDGWVIARLLFQKGYNVTAVSCEIGQRSPDNTSNFHRFSQLADQYIVSILPNDPFPHLPAETIIIDALFGTGLNRPITGYWAELVTYLNAQDHLIISIDLPSGLFADAHSNGAVIEADYTFTFQLPKLALFAPENEKFVGRWSILDIGLDADFIDAVPTPYSQIDPQRLRQQLYQRGPYDHKGTFGHTLVVAGSHGKIGAATLCAHAALRAGAGLVSLHVPQCGYEIAQIAFPEAMCQVDRHRFVFTQVGDLSPYRSLAVGPGLGTNVLTVGALEDLLKKASYPIVLDADALNLIGKNPHFFELIPTNSILTPHPKEFERLFGATDNDFARWKLQREKAQSLGLIIVLKTGHTSVATPEGKLIFNTTGNPGMGTAGTGDVLTGILAGLLAQSYAPSFAAALGVYLHGLAGDIAAGITEQESLLASDVIANLGRAYAELRKA